MIVGSYFPLLYYFFYCDPFWMVFYMSLIALLGVATLLVSWLPWFQHPQYAPLRALTFVSLGSTCLLMIPHFLALDPTPYGCLLRMLFMGMTYICGAVCLFFFSSSLFPLSPSGFLIFIFFFFFFLLFSGSLCDKCPRKVVPRRI